MKIIGLIGGISWISTADYYRYINQGINAKLGGSNFANCIIYSFNYADIMKNNERGDWDATLAMVKAACDNLKNSGAEAILLCANTMHKIADDLRERIDIPIIHIAEVTAEAIRKQQLNKVALLGTKFTMELDFFKLKLQEKNIEALIPDAEERAFIHQSIHDELGKGIINPETKSRYQSIIQKLVDQGAQGVILGCTEIPLLIKQEDVTVPAFDTTLIHSEAAVAFALS